MSGQLAAGLVLGTAAAAAAGTGIRWFAIAALAAAGPFVGLSLALGGMRARHVRAASPTR
ncbi:MAG TPA: hypothetical protein VMN35_03935 [Gaiellaceae bacterium]|nr:hypothetical protein [Gaiellaceae bacterium]